MPLRLAMQPEMNTIEGRDPADKGWTALVQKLSGWFGLSVPFTVRDELVLLQFERLRALVPVLYLTIAVNTLAGAAATQGDFPPLYQLAFPACLLFASAVRFFIWHRRRHDRATLASAQKHLRTTFFIAIILSLAGGFWSIASFYETHETRRVLAAVFITMSAFASANCLASLPRAAIASIVVGLAPIVVAMLGSHDLGIQAMAVSIFVVSILQIRLVLSKFTEMANGIMLQREMRELADSDPLTGLRNRRAFTAQLEAETAKLASGGRVVMAMLDLDGFKPANDRFGHAAGDAILVETAKRLQTMCRTAHCVARIGGDEFAIILDTEGDRGAIDSIVEAVRAIIALPHIIGGEYVAVSASIGVAHGPGDGRTVSQLLLAADHALYANKSARTNRPLSTILQLGKAA